MNKPLIRVVLIPRWDISRIFTFVISCLLDSMRKINALILWISLKWKIKISPHHVSFLQVGPLMMAHLKGKVFLSWESVQVATCRQQWHYLFSVTSRSLEHPMFFCFFEKEKKYDPKSLLKYQFRLILVIVDRLLEAGKNLSARDLNQSNFC